MKDKVIDLTGKKFGRLTVTRRAANVAGDHAAWWVKCDCGNNFTVVASNLKSGCTKSCGCIRDELSKLNAVERSEVDLKRVKKQSNLEKIKFVHKMKKAQERKNEQKNS